MKRTLCALLICFLFMSASAQSLPAGSAVLEEYYRSRQIMGNEDPILSFMVRPLSSEALSKKDVYFPERSGTDSTILNLGSEYRSGDSVFLVKLLPFQWQNQYNSSRPYGWNDGSMIPSVGFQTSISAGVYAKAGFVSIQLQPELVSAENKQHNGKDIYQGSPDLPIRFGNSGYTKASWGQSSIRLNYAGLSLGLSNENLWWGPGKYNSLLMSNNTEGFKHLAFNTIRPLRTPLGSLDFQMLGGKLENSRFNSVNEIPEYNDWRYLAGFTLNYQPKFVPGLFFGLSRVYQTYQRNVRTFRDYVPFLEPFQKVKTVNNDSVGSDMKDQIASFFARWIFPESRGEIYFEYGVNDHAYNLRDFFGSPEHSRAYLFGFSKIIPIGINESKIIKFNAEVTQMSQHPDRLVREAGSWYWHGQMIQGYTHQGQVIGAGIGPGGNLLTLDIAWMSDLKSIGFRFDRYVRNDDHYELYLDPPNSPGKWVDLSSSFYGTWTYKNLLLNAKLQFVSPLNYQWEREELDNSGILVSKGGGFNFQGQLGLMYRF